MYMRTLVNFPNGWSCALLLSVVIGCKQSDSGEVTPADQTCQVQTMNVAVSGGATTPTTFSYDAKGQLTSVVTSSGQGSFSMKTTETYTYDDNGYVTAYKYAESSLIGNSTDRDETYFYENGRLSKTTFKNVTQSIGTSSSQINGTTTYNYDAAGALTQMATLSTSTSGFIGLPSSPSTSSSTRTYANGALTSIKELTNGKESTKYTIENGLVTLETKSNGSKTRYTYNADGYQTKLEGITSANIITGTLITEYGSMPAPKSVYPVQKGFPVIPPSHGKQDRVVSRQTSASGATIDYQYQVNSKGYPVKLVKTNTGTTITTFTYANCVD